MSKVLIIEDDDFFRELVTKKIGSTFDMIEANDGEKGVEMAKKEKPDLILLDLLLPGIDGFEVLNRIKADPELAKIPIINLSNLGQQEDIEKALKLGSNDFLVKSQFDINQIIDKIKSFL